MASVTTMLNEKSSPNNSESESESDSEIDNDDDSETTESLFSFDQSEEEDHLSSEEDIIEEPASGHLPCLTEYKKILNELSLLIWKTLSKSKMVNLLQDFVESEFFFD